MATAVQLQELRRNGARVYQEGTEKYPDFQQKVQTLAQTYGELPIPFLETLYETDSPVDVIHALASDLGRAAQILDMSPNKQGLALAKLEAELKAKPAAKPAPKPAVSNAPPPIKPQVSGQAVSVDKTTYDEPGSDAEWMALRAKEVAERRKKLRRN